MSTFLDGRVALHLGDCRYVLATFDDCSLDACVTDPPYHLQSIHKRFAARGRDETSERYSAGPYGRHATGFMGKKWDGGDVSADPTTWAAIYRVLKPGAHLVAFSGTRTYHRMACAIEDVGFEMRDQLAWVYGSGFPKSHNIGDGWGTALKPSHEPVVLCSKPLTVEQHFAVVLAELNARIIRWLSCDASAAANNLNDFQVRLLAEANSVLDGAKIKSLESIGVVPSAAVAFTFNALASIDLIRTRASFALSHVRQDGNADEVAGQRVQSGVADDISTRLLDMSTSVSMGGITLENIVSSWQHILEDLLPSTSKFTIATATKLTTALKILNCSPHPSTSGDIGALSPNEELICLARKPLSEKTVAANVLKWGTGAINVDGCRVATNDSLGGGAENPDTDAVYKVEGWDRPWMHNEAARAAHSARVRDNVERAEKLGRWPANLAHDGSDEVLAVFPESGGQQGNIQGSEPSATGDNGIYGHFDRVGFAKRNDSGSAARFFYTAKANADERLGSKHPTVKPIDLMQWLVRLVTPNGGLVLDPFAGTGTTGEAAWREGMRAVLIEREAEYCTDIHRRMQLALAGPSERIRESVKAKGQPVDYGPLFEPRESWDQMWQRPFDYGALK